MDIMTTLLSTLEVFKCLSHLTRQWLTAVHRLPPTTYTESEPTSARIFLKLAWLSCCHTCSLSKLGSRS